MGSAKFKTILVALGCMLMAQSCHGTACGDASDGSVANCCDAFKGYCENVRINP
jgi:hypothetical protein